MVEPLPAAAAPAEARTTPLQRGMGTRAHEGPIDPLHGPIDGVQQERNPDNQIPPTAPPTAPTAVDAQLEDQSIQPSTVTTHVPPPDSEQAVDTGNDDTLAPVPFGAAGDAAVVKRIHPLMGAKSRKDSTTEEQTAAYRSYLDHLCGRKCISSSSKRPTQCTCMMDIKDDNSRLDGCAAYLLEFGQESRKGRQEKVMDMIKAMGGLKSDSKFNLPSVGLKEDGSVIPVHPICRNALQQVLNMQDKAMRSINGYVKQGCYGPPEFHLAGRTGDDANRTLPTSSTDPLHDFFKAVEKLAAPRATVLVRLEAGIGVRQSDTEQLELPPFMSKRGLFKRYLNNRGYEPSTDSKGNITVNPIPNEVQLGHVSWVSFQTFWDRHYSHVSIVKPRRDICGECFKYAQSSKSYAALVTDDDASQPQTMRNVQPAAAPPIPQELDYEAREKELLEAALHCKRSAIQREEFNAFTAAAVKDYVEKVPHHKRSYVFCADFAQNIQLPHYGSQQPGETFYFCPLTIPEFGMVDVSTGHLQAYFYHEGDAKKGGDVVTSLMYKYFKDRNLLRTGDDAGFELTICMDNCAGQNKNRMTLRFLVWLVEMGYFQQVRFMYLITGQANKA